MESVGDDANSVFHEDQKFFKSDTIFVTFKSVTFEIFGKCSESVNFDANNDLQEDLKIFKSDTFESTKVLYLQKLWILEQSCCVPECLRSAQGIFLA